MGTLDRPHDAHATFTGPSDGTIAGDSNTPALRIQIAPGETTLTLSHANDNVTAHAAQRAVDAVLGPQGAGRVIVGTPPDNAHRGAPQDRQKAIVEAATEFARAAGLWVLDRDDAATWTADSFARVSEEATALARALALPEPEWTTEWPATEGDYWIRRRIVGGDFEHATLAHVTSEAIYVDDAVDLRRSVVERYAPPPWEFWPVPIEPPPA